MVVLPPELCHHRWQLMVPSLPPHPVLLKRCILFEAAAIPGLPNTG